MIDLRMPKSTPRVSRSTFVEANNVIAIEGTQFEDGLRRLVVAPEASDEIVKLLTNALVQLDHVDGAARWIRDVLSGNPRKDVQ